MLIGLSGTGPRTSILHVWHTSFVNFFAINHVLWSHDEIIFHLNLSAVPKKSDICVHSTFSANWTKCRKIWKKNDFVLKETFFATVAVINASAPKNDDGFHGDVIRLQSQKARFYEFLFTLGWRLIGNTSLYKFPALKHVSFRKYSSLNFRVFTVRDTKRGMLSPWKKSLRLIFSSLTISSIRRYVYAQVC